MTYLAVLSEKRESMCSAF